MLHCLWPHPGSLMGIVGYYLKFAIWQYIYCVCMCDLCVGNTWYSSITSHTAVICAHKHTFADLLIHIYSISVSCINVTSTVQHSWREIFILQTYTQRLPLHRPALPPSYCIVKKHSHGWSYHREHDSSSVRPAPLTRWCAVGPKVSNKNGLAPEI